MSIQGVSAELFAELFHQYQHALAQDASSASVSDPDEECADVPVSEKNLRIAAARLALLEVELLPTERESRRVFCKAGRSGVGLLSRVAAWNRASYSL